jgi:hypothetical protein
MTFRRRSNSGTSALDAPSSGRVRSFFFHSSEPPSTPPRAEQPPEDVVVVSDRRARRTSFLDLGPDSRSTDDLFSLNHLSSLHHHLRRSTSTQFPPSSFHQPSRSAMGTNPTLPGVAWRTRKPLPTLDLVDEDVAPLQLESVRTSETISKSKGSTLLKTVIRRIGSVGSVNAPTLSNAKPGDRNSFESSSSSAGTVESDLGFGYASSTTSYSHSVMSPQYQKEFDEEDKASVDAAGVRVSSPSLIGDDLVGNANMREV